MQHCVIDIVVASCNLQMHWLLIILTRKRVLNHERGQLPGRMSQLVPGKPEHWLLLAADAKRVAEGMADANSKRTMVLIAAGYEIMAKRAARIANSKPSDEPTKTDAVAEPSMKLHSAEYWRSRAEEARTHAESTLSIDCGSAMLKIAEMYDELARRSERMAKEFPDVEWIEARPKDRRT